MKETVIFVHGLWMPGHEMTLLRQRVKKCGYNVTQFSYPSMRFNTRVNAKRLNTFAAGIRADKVHFVGHSLGGLVIRWLFHDYPDQKPGRVVTLGTPHQGSQVAKAISQHPFGRRLLGSSTECGLLGDMPPWSGDRDLGVIAGTHNMGLGVLTAGLQDPADGVVAEAETHLPGMTDHITLPLFHFGLMVSKLAAQQICAFLKSGKFTHQ